VTIERRGKLHASLRDLEADDLFVKVWERYEASPEVNPVRDARAECR
jgi:hypothetical protein